MASAILQSLMHPDELMALVQYKLDPAMQIPKMTDISFELQECYRLLNLTSRSFAMVIQKLDDDLRPAICIFYLVLRGLDTIEDDMTIPLNKKIALMHEFDTSIKTPGWTFTGSGPNEKDAHLLVQFNVVIHEYLKLKPIFQEAISDITRRMAHGMTEFMTRKVVTCQDWDLYCHYVAGLVGIGLSRIFSGSKIESPVVGQREDMSNSMGLFLQKTNIIRDYLEDIDQGRIFWPQEVWEQYVKQKGEDLSAFKNPANREEALDCLNHLINNALAHIPDVITYMSQLKNQSVFNFCALPQVMAIATLSACYNNYNVFTGVVKIRKGEAVKLIFRAKDLPSLVSIFDDYLENITSKVGDNLECNPVKAKTLQLIASLRKQGSVPKVPPPTSVIPFVVIFLLALFFSLLLVISKDARMLLF
jgi:farnesyl-diphosphate farnesyltransferase